MASILGSNYLQTPCVVYCAGIRNCSLGSSLCGGILIRKEGHKALFISELSGCCSWYSHCTCIINSGCSAAGWWFPDRCQAFVAYETRNILWTPTTHTCTYSPYYIECCSSANAYIICFKSNGSLGGVSKSLFTYPSMMARVVYY